MRLGNRHSVTLPYVQGFSKTICRILRSSGIGSHFKPQNLLRNHLVHPKDKTEPLDYSGTIYHIKCKQCDVGYVGETERPLRIRLAEHKWPSNKSSAVQAHAKEYEIAWDKIELLDFFTFKSLERMFFKRAVTRMGTRKKI